MYSKTIQVQKNGGILFLSPTPFRNKKTTHNHTVLPPLAKPSQLGYCLSGRETEVCCLAGVIPACVPASSSRPCSARLLFLIQNCMALPHGGPVGVLLHPLEPRGQQCSQATWSIASPSQVAWLSQFGCPIQGFKLPGWIFLCNPISDSSHEGLHLTVFWFLLPF